MFILSNARNDRRLSVALLDSIANGIWAAQQDKCWISTCNVIIEISKLTDAPRLGQTATMSLHQFSIWRGCRPLVWPHRAPHVIKEQKRGSGAGYPFEVSTCILDGVCDNEAILITTHPRQIERKVALSVLGLQKRVDQPSLCLNGLLCSISTYLKPYGIR